MRRWQLTVGLSVAAVGAAVVAPILTGTAIVAATTPTPSAEIVTTPAEAPDEAPAPTPIATEVAPIEPPPTVATFPDRDGDGFGDDDHVLLDDHLPEGHVLVGGDCDDRNASRYPGAPEIAGDGIDQDCDGRDASKPRSLPRPTPRDPAPTLLIPELDAAPIHHRPIHDPPPPARPQKRPQRRDPDLCLGCGMG